MAKHAPTMPTTLARRRHVRAAPGAMDRRHVPAPAIIPAGPPIPITAADRDRIAGNVEMLLDLLNLLDDDTDESDGTEDSVLDGTVARRTEYAVPFDEECEPSLGWTTSGHPGSTDDGEDAQQDAEPDFDAEPLSGPHTPDGGMLGGMPQPGDMRPGSGGQAVGA